MPMYALCMRWMMQLEFWWAQGLERRRRGIYCDQEEGQGQFSMLSMIVGWDVPWRRAPD